MAMCYTWVLPTIIKGTVPRAMGYLLLSCMLGGAIVVAEAVAWRPASE